MFRNYKQQAPSKVRRKKHLQDEQTPALPITPKHPTLQMQSLIGNQATQRMIQRMPTHGSILGTLGQPKADVKAFGKVIKKNSTKYQAVLNAVQAYDRYLVNTTLAADKSGMQGQFQAALALLDSILTTINAYNGKTDVKAQYFMGMKPQVMQEKNKVAVSMLRVINNPVDYSLTGRPKFGNVLRVDSKSTLKEGDVVGGDRGGTSEVKEYGGANPGFFKANKGTLYDPSQGLEERPDENAYARDMRAEEVLEQKREDLTTEHGRDKGEQLLTGLENEYRLGVKMVGIKSQDARMAKRDVATSRLNQLLGSNIIAKAQMSIQDNGDGTKTEGSLMEKAQGKSINKMAQEDRFYDPSTETKGGSQQTSLQDPKLMQLLSKLQLIDQLAFQVDRNTGNYYVQVDGNGNVIGLTGIDNDFALGTNTDLSKTQQKLPPLSKYADEEMATAIINLDPELVRAAMSDLLDDEEITALLTRLKTMQEHLKVLQSKGELLKPSQWNAAMAQKLMDEKVGPKRAFNYYQQLIEAQKSLKPQKPKTK